MVTVLPPTVGELQEMESTPERAMTLATNLRAVTTSVKDVQGWAGLLGAGEWAGDTKDAADHALTRFGRRLSGPEAALLRAATATDRLEDRLRGLQARRSALESRRTALNTDIETLEGEIGGAGHEVDEATVRAWERRAERLRTRAGDLSTDISAWETDYAGAERDYIAALREVDSVAEGEVAASDPALPDVDGLSDAFHQRAGSPALLSAWWRSLSRAQQQALMTEHPELVGNADGIPVRDRDEANRAGLYSDVDALSQRDADGQLTEVERRILDNARTIRDELDDYKDRVDPSTGDHLANLIVYKPGIHTTDGGVAISFGDPDRADHVAAFVPGLTSETSSIDGNLKSIDSLYAEAATNQNGSVATVFWLDYDAPSGDFSSPEEILDFAEVVTPGAAERGGERFGDFIDGLRASDRGERAHLTAIGHSYGSTAVGHALEDGARVDDAVLVGSPGQPVATADALTDADVWVGSKDYDPVTLLGLGDRGGIGALGHDPAQETFGGTRFETGDGSYQVEDLLENHTSYFDGESLDNLGSIVADKDGDVTRDDRRDAWTGGHYQTLEELLLGTSVASGGDWLWDRGEDVVGGIGETLTGSTGSLTRGFGPGRFVL